MNDPTHAVIKAQFILSSNDAKKHEGTIATVAKVANHLVTRYSASAVTAKADEDICHFSKAR